MAVTGEMNTTTMVVWLVRILLPIIFFFIWYRLGSGDSNAEDQHTREELLLAREVVKGCEVPECLNNIKLVEEARVAAPATQRQQRGNQARPKRGDNNRGRNTDNITKNNSFGPGDLDEAFGVEASAATGDAGAAPAVSNKPKPLLEKVEREQFESLLTFVAFGHKDRPQRVFLPDEGRPPPPPPKKAAPAVVEALDEESPETTKANADAQAALKAIVNQKIGLKCSHVASNLYEKLLDSQIRIAEATFTLMVEACIASSDLKGASGFLMKMESNGLCPDSDLLDKVMDLYSESRANNEGTESEAPAPMFGKLPSE